MTVSLCVIALNEAAFLPRLLNDLFNQTYPKEKTEIVLIDSGSSDDTKYLMNQFADANRQKYISIKVLDNQKRIQAAGWNKALQAACGDVIIRIDAHTHIPAEFTAKNMENIKSGEYVSGGVRPCISENRTAWGDLLLETENSLFGSSFNVSRRGIKKQYVKTMFHAAYRREVFASAGGFNENLLRTEDNEMHYRIRKAGYRFCFDPKIVSYQYARNSLRKMVRQKYGNGYWIGLTMGVCPKCISPFHLVPFAFLLGILFTTVLALLGYGLLAALMWCAYGLFVLAGTVACIINGKANRLVPLMPLLFLVLHVSYGAGTLVGLVKMPFQRKKLGVCEEIEITRRAVQASRKE